MKSSTPGHSREYKVLARDSRTGSERGGQGPQQPQLGQPTPVAPTFISRDVSGSGGGYRGRSGEKQPRDRNASSEASTNSWRWTQVFRGPLQRGGRDPARTHAAAAGGDAGGGEDAAEEPRRGVQRAMVGKQAGRTHPPAAPGCPRAGDAQEGSAAGRAPRPPEPPGPPGRGPAARWTAPGAARQRGAKQAAARAARGLRRGARVRLPGGGGSSSSSCSSGPANDPRPAAAAAATPRAARSPAPSPAPLRLPPCRLRPLPSVRTWSPPRGRRRAGAPGRGWGRRAGAAAAAGAGAPGEGSAGGGLGRCGLLMAAARGPGAK